MSNDLYSNMAKGTSNGLAPDQPQVYSQVLNLVLNTPVVFDLKPLVYQNRIKNVQGIWIDNSAGTAPLSVSSVTLQNFIVPVGFQGLMPLYVSADNVLTFSGAGAIPIVLLNFPTPAAVWPTTTGSAATVIGGLLQVQDAALEAVLQAGGLSVVPMLYGNGDTPAHARAGNNIINGTVNAAATTVLLAGAPSVFIDWVDIAFDGGATPAVTGSINVRLFFGTSAKTIFQRQTFLTNAAPATDQAPLQVARLNGLNLTGALAGDNLSLTLGTALTLGNLQYSIGAGTTAVA